MEKQNDVGDCMKGEENVPGERGRDWDDVCNSRWFGEYRGKAGKQKPPRHRRRASGIEGGVHILKKRDNSVVFQVERKLSIIRLPDVSKRGWKSSMLGFRRLFSAEVDLFLREKLPIS